MYYEESNLASKSAILHDNVTLAVKSFNRLLVIESLVFVRLFVLLTGMLGLDLGLKDKMFGLGLEVQGLRLGLELET